MHQVVANDRIRFFADLDRVCPGQETDSNKCFALEIRHWPRDSTPGSGSLVPRSMCWEHAISKPRDLPVGPGGIRCVRRSNGERTRIPKTCETLCVNQSGWLSWPSYPFDNAGNVPSITWANLGSTVELTRQVFTPQPVAFDGYSNMTRNAVSPGRISARLPNPSLCMTSSTSSIQAQQLIGHCL